MEPRSFTFVSQGKVPQSISEAIRDAVAVARGEFLKLTLAKSVPFSSDSQREYYFAVIVPAWQKILHEAQDEFWDKDDTHDYLMEEIGGWFKPLKKGQKRPSRRSYTKLTKAEGEKHHELCRAAAAKEGVQIALPNERDFYE